MTLANQIKKSVGSHKPTKSPQIYMQEFKQVIRDTVNHENVDVRNAVCGHQYCPTKMLTERLMVEDDIDVIRTILLNPKTPYTAALQFANERPELADQFSADAEVIAKLSQ